MVIDPAAARLEALAGADPTAAPLARLQLVVLREAAESAWDEAVPSLSAERLRDGMPLLHEVTLRVDAGRTERLVLRLVEVVRITARDEADRVRSATGEGRLDVGELVEASVTQQDARLEVMAGRAEVAPGLLAALGHLAVFPLLQACGRQAAALVIGSGWDASYCPVCAAWPTLAELRGLERRRHLRCGRCAADWAIRQDGCVFCGTDDSRARGYLAPEADRESRRALTCSECQGYLKAVTTVRPLGPGEIGLRDLETLELDAAAIERGFGRPDAPAFPLTLTVEATRQRTLWTPWRR